MNKSILLITIIFSLTSVALDYKDFGKLPFFSNVTISPDGEKIAALANMGYNDGVFSMQENKIIQNISTKYKTSTQKSNGIGSTKKRTRKTRAAGVRKRGISPEKI